VRYPCMVLGSGSSPARCCGGGNCECLLTNHKRPLALETRQESAMPIARGNPRARCACGGSIQSGGRDARSMVLIPQCGEHSPGKESARNSPMRRRRSSERRLRCATVHISSRDTSPSTPPKVVFHLSGILSGKGEVARADPVSPIPEGVYRLGHHTWVRHCKAWTANTQRR